MGADLGDTIFSSTGSQDTRSDASYWPWSGMIEGKIGHLIAPML